MIKPKLPIKPHTLTIPKATSLALVTHWRVSKPWLLGMVLVQCIAWLCAFVQCETALHVCLNRLMGWQLYTGLCDLSHLLRYQVFIAGRLGLLLWVGTVIWMLKVAPATVRTWLFWFKHDPDLKRNLEYASDGWLSGWGRWDGVMRCLAVLLAIMMWLLLTMASIDASLNYPKSWYGYIEGAAIDSHNLGLLLSEYYFPTWFVIHIVMGLLRLWLLANVVIYLSYVWMRITGRLHQAHESGL
ncbi:hypothetical protein LVJ82_15120 [Vitreoscilla massiliensis]|uniref:Uncharacterized protein n=1 Tax=Vitreoscilla massiliensis TaxID=1689272 RepID=A0ABY4E0H5_9NEIS|nr:hypothetical protein [Vitreoscilla massiliensis]UOO88774.1 hypothetical protein LVJ82_15120 [Vitreoscilla massiliensis]